METISAEAQYTLQFINQTQKSIFLTGKAGTGKTTLLREKQINCNSNKKELPVFGKHIHKKCVKIERNWRAFVYKVLINSLSVDNSPGKTGNVTCIEVF